MRRRLGRILISVFSVMICTAYMGCAGVGGTRFTAHGDGTVTDNVTGLMWQQKTGGSGYPTTWGDGIFCDNLRIGVYTDWRLPNMKELMSLVDYTKNNSPAIDTKAFPDTFSSYYWASSLRSRYGSPVNFHDGTFEVGDPSVEIPYTKGYVLIKRGYAFFRCVRGEENSRENVTDNGNGTISDGSTGLTWQKQDDATKRTWEESIRYCKGLSFGGKTDWRLPNVKELMSIVDYTKYEPVIDTEAFPSTQPLGDYWSSTSVANPWLHAPCNCMGCKSSPFTLYGSSLAWHVDFSVGLVRYGCKADDSYVRCVRGGQ